MFIKRPIRFFEESKVFCEGKKFLENGMMSKMKLHDLFSKLDKNYKKCYKNYKNQEGPFASQESVRRGLQTSSEALPSLVLSLSSTSSKLLLVSSMAKILGFLRSHRKMPTFDDRRRGSGERGGSWPVRRWW